MAQRIAVLFDMDGVLVDNSEYHYLSWKRFLERQGMHLEEGEFRRTLFGRTGQDTLRFLFGDDLSDDNIDAYRRTIDAIYRKEYKDHIAPTPGLAAFLNDLRRQSIVMAIATSGPPENVDFVLDALGIRGYFSAIVDGSMVARGKPDPEIYIKAAGAVHCDPSACVVIEDSNPGLEAAKNAGMKTIGITTTHDASALRNVDLLITGFSEVNADGVKALLDQKGDR